MAGPGYGGFFLKGLAGGLQTGINLGLQIQEMQWQKAQRKKLEEKEKKIEEGMATFGSLIRQYGTDNVYSDEEVMQLNTAFMSSIAEVQAAYKDAMNNIQTINKRKLEEDFQLLDLVISSIDDLSPGDAQGIFDTVKGWVRTDKAKNYFTAFEEIHRKRYEAREPDINKELGISAKLPGEYRYPYLKGKGIVGEITPTPAKPEAPGITDYKGAADYLSKFAQTASPETFEKIRAGLQKQFPDIDLSAITQRSLKEPVKPITEPTPAPTSTENIRRAISDADTVKDAQRIYKNYADKYDETALGIPEGGIDRFWAESQIPYLNKIKTAIGNIIDEKGWLKKGTLTSVEVGIDFKGKQSVEEIYKRLREEYMKYRDMLEKLGIDISQFPELKPLEEIERVGLGEGFWGWGKQKGQYKSIYK